jgi:hypothetical protein
VNKKVKIAWGVAAGLTLFAGAFVGFALMLGVPLSKVFSIARETDGEGRTATVDGNSLEPALEKQPAEPARPAGLGLLDVFQIQAPFSGDELQRLADELKRKLRELDLQRTALTEHEQRVVRRAELLDEQYAELQSLRARLDEWNSELAQRQAEVERDESARSARDQASWAALGKLFADGDAAELGERLASYPPEEAAKVLHTLKPARAKELLDGLAADKWKDYAEAYRKGGAPVE